jgi:hypothetical protein
MFDSQQLQHFGSVYSEIKYWLPMVTIGTVIWKARAAVTQWADKLFSNHLSHIESATVSNAEEAKQTNVLLRDHSGKLEAVQNTLSAQHDKQLQVWAGVTEALIVLKERTRTRKSTTPKRKR